MFGTAAGGTAGGAIDCESGSRHANGAPASATATLSAMPNAGGRARGIVADALVLVVVRHVPLAVPQRQTNQHALVRRHCGAVRLSAQAGDDARGERRVHRARALPRARAGASRR